MMLTLVYTVMRWFIQDNRELRRFLMLKEFKETDRKGMKRPQNVERNEKIRDEIKANMKKDMQEPDARKAAARKYHLAVDTVRRIWKQQGYYSD
jgi:adenylate kinase